MSMQLPVTAQRVGGLHVATRFDGVPARKSDTVVVRKNWDEWNEAHRGASTGSGSEHDKIQSLMESHPGFEHKKSDSDGSLGVWSHSQKDGSALTPTSTIRHQADGSWEHTVRDDGSSRGDKVVASGKGVDSLQAHLTSKEGGHYHLEDKPTPKSWGGDYHLQKAVLDK